MSNTETLVQSFYEINPDSLEFTLKHWDAYNELKRIVESIFDSGTLPESYMLKAWQAQWLSKHNKAINLFELSTIFPIIAYKSLLRHSAFFGS